jgi:hypothetical protein
MADISAQRSLAELTDFSRDLSEALAVERQILEFRARQSNYLAALLRRFRTLIQRLEQSSERDERLRVYFTESGLSERAKQDTIRL